MRKYMKNKSKKNKIITSSVVKITILFVFVAVIVMLYQNSMTSNIVADNNRQRGQEKFEVVKGSKLKIGDYVNYDHTLQVDPNTKETIKVPKEKLKYTSVKGDLVNSGNGVATQTVDVSGYKTKWRVYDIQGDQVLLMPETQPTAEITAKSALGYLWYEKEAHNIAGLYGHGYGADETKKFEYQVGSRIPSEKDTKTETTEGTGARPMLLKDIEEAYEITTDEQRQELSDYEYKNDNQVGSNKLEDAIYYPTLNKTNARRTEENIDGHSTGDIGVSKTTKKLTDIKQEYYLVQSKLNQLHTKTYDAKTGKDVQKEIIHNYWNRLGSRSFYIHSTGIGFNGGDVYTDKFYPGGSFGGGISSYFDRIDGSLFPRPVVFLSSVNNYYKEQGNGEYATYSMIKEENSESQHPKIQNPYDVSLANVSLKGMYANRLIFESKLGAPLENLPKSITRADGTKVIDITYTVEGLPEGITYDVIKKQVNGKEEITVQIYPKELSVLANIAKTNIYDGAKYSYDILLNRNGNKISSKALDEIADVKIEIAKYTNKEDIIDSEGNAVNYVLDIANFNDIVRKDNTYYTNIITKDDKANSNEIIYNLNIVYDKAKYDGVVNKITTDLSDIEKRVNTLKTEEKTKKVNIDILTPKVGDAEKKGKATKEEKQELVDELSKIQEKQKVNETEVGNLKIELDKLIKENNDNKNIIDNNNELKTKADELTKKISDLEIGIKTESETIKDLKDRIDKLEVNDVEKLIADLDDIEKRTNELENNDNTKKKDIAKLEEEVKTAETNGGTDVLGKKKLEEGIADIKKRQEAEKAEREKLEQELKDLISGNEKGLETEKELKDKADKLTKRINDLKETIEKDDEKIKELEDRISKIKVLDVKDIEELKKKVADLEDKNKKANADIEENKKTIANLNKLIEKLKGENKEAIDKLNKEKEELENTNKKLEEENKKLKDKITELNAEIEQLKNLEQENKNLENKIAELEGKLLEAEAKQNDLQEKLNKCSKHGKELEEQIKALEKTIKEQDEKIKKLEQEKADLEKRNKELEEKNKLNEEKLKEKELLEKKIKELEEKVKTLEAEKAKLAKAAMDKKEQEQKDKEKEEDSKEPEKVADADVNNNKATTKNNTVATKANKNNSKNTSNNKIPHAGAGSLIALTIITAGAIVYTKKVINKK